MLLTKVTNAIVKIMGCPAESVVLTANLSALGIDSLKAINILFELEEEFNIEIPNELIADMVTVQDIVDAIASLRNEQTH